MATIGERLVDLAQGIRFEDLPAEVVHEAGRRVLDTLGCVIAGVDGSTSQQVLQVMRELGGIQEASILGTAELTSCERATLVNATSLRYLDFGDGHLGPYPCHTSFNIPPILAAAERAGASGRQLVLAIVVAYEIMPRFMECTGLPDPAGRAWFGSTELEFSIPLAIAPLLGLNREQMVHALAISITHGNTLSAPSYGPIPTSISIIYGMTAMNAVIATLLAQQGLTGPPGAIEGPGGYTRAVAGSCDYDCLLAPVGRYKILDISTKWHNTVKCGRTAVAAALQLLQEYHKGWRDIDTIHIGLTRHDWQHQTQDASGSLTRPKTHNAANHSVRYGVAAALIEGELGPEQYRPEKLTAPHILDLIDRTSLYWEEAHDIHWPAASPATIKIRTTDGRELSKTIVFAPGHPSNPLPDEAIEHKFKQLTRKALASGQIAAIIAATGQLADLPDVRMLTRMMRPQVHDGTLREREGGKDEA